MVALALGAVGLWGCAPSPRTPCASCEVREPPGPYLTTCFAESRPYDTNFGCSTRPEGQVSAILFTNGLRQVRLHRVLAMVDGKTIFDSNLRLVLSRDTFPLATLPILSVGSTVQIEVQLAGTDRLAGYRFEIRSHHEIKAPLTALSVELYHNDKPLVEESLSLRYVETPQSAAPNTDL